MELYKDKKECFGCGACVYACPKKAIQMKEDEEGFLYPQIDNGLCVDCGLCLNICPSKQNISKIEKYFYALKCKDTDLLRKSSSGGAFSVLSEKIIKNGGFVCGAIFDEKFQVKHIISQDISSMRKSKYVQSNMKDLFLSVKAKLKEGKTVIFSGTPCQCHAMDIFCKDRKENLFLVSLVCRGVCSPGFWKDYIFWLSKGNLEQYDFRDKSKSNDGHTVLYTINGTKNAISMDKDAFFALYNRCLIYRPSCYDCPYCTVENNFDFTIGDFWGIEKVSPNLYDGLGTSLVIVRGRKAADLLKSVESEVLLYSCKQQDIMQPALCSPARQSILRKLLFRDFARKNENGVCDMDLILKKYACIL